MFISDYAQENCANGTFRAEYFSIVVSIERMHDRQAEVSFFDWFAMFCGV